MNDIDKKTAIEAVEKAVRDLGEHWQCVQVLACAEADDQSEGTHFYRWGRGNIFARVQMMRELILENEQRIREKIKHEDDEEEEA